MGVGISVYVGRLCVGRLYVCVHVCACVCVCVCVCVLREGKGSSVMGKGTHWCHLSPSASRTG